ncbi:aldehyde dehydrogenase family protein [Paremcibacter congregatus]|uniref:Aldehyde dehydrogenase PuuC n=1 Tax=Paremcibacter congregatus TaxID=2043170 RepID=A0A2G4YT40_9PROT|nr:aldehyde dehydrogenase family protein [Paremcibacter congregatus]PHZ85498.1 aldehyde dehydrogenase PuuC [Paremcibacter congregatus]QDE26248.1 aldehyde dehydrogenase family protein [Paremcibacter congregatus]
MTDALKPNTWNDRASGVAFESRPFIGGDYGTSTSRDVFTTENPANNVKLAEFPDGSADDIDRAVISARKAFRSEWQYFAPEQRKILLITLADKIEAAREELALYDCLEMGMPISMALEQVDMAVSYMRYNAELADKIYGEVAPADAVTTLAMTYKLPRGVVGVISPWNYPLMTAMMAIAPALAAGNSLVVKPSEIAPSSALRLAAIGGEAGLPPGVLNVVPGRGISTGAALAKHMDVDKLHFTGSTKVGRQLMVYAGQSNAKPVMLEMGGKSPQIVFKDAVDIKDLGATLAQYAFMNTGQLCVARTRLIVHESIKEQVLDLMRKETRNVFTIGDPLDEKTSFGPIASRKQFDNVRSYIDVGKKEGANLQTIVTGGEMPEDGCFIQPAIFDNAHNAMRICQEEIFGPIMSVISFKTDEEAIRLANDVSYGLAATAWTKDLGLARRLARDLEVGSVEIRAAAGGGASPNALTEEPFGASGHGAVGGRRGLDPYTRLKAVQIITD